MEILSPQELLKRYETLSDAEKEQFADLLAEHFSQEEKRPANLTHCAKGRLVFEYKVGDGEDKPLHNIDLELWDRDLVTPDDFLASGQTDEDGYFEIWYDPTNAGFRDECDLELRIFDRHHVFHNDSTIEETLHLIHKIAGDDDVDDENYEFGTVRVPYWEYDPTSELPKVLIPTEGDPPQAYSPGRTFLLTKIMAPLELIKRKHFAINKFNSRKPSIPSLQKDYPDSETIRLEKERPGYTRSDEYFADRILNGMSASIVDKDRNYPGWYRLYHHWNAYEQDGYHCLPNVDMRFEIQDGKLMPVQITLQIRKKGIKEPHGEMDDPITLTPADGIRWAAAKRVARVSAALSAELDVHLAQTHLNLEQYAIPLYRNLRKNPLRYLLFPHVKEVVLINDSARSFLIGKTGYISRASALTNESINLRIREMMGTLDWKAWHPRRPITEDHRFAHNAKIFWDLLTDYVDEFFEEYADGIREHWYEVHRFSQDLIEHSVPFQPTTMGDLDWFWFEGEDHPLAEIEEDHGDWFDPNERMDLDIPRYELNGVKIAVQPVTITDIPQEQDIQNMKELCRYVIYHATFFHTWPNSRQYVDGGEIEYNSLGLRYGRNGVLSRESDHSISPSPKEATELLWISYFLTHACYGHIMANEDKDIHPKFIESLREKEKEFEKHGLDIYKIQSRTNI